jgi:putative transposase
LWVAGRAEIVKSPEAQYRTWAGNRSVRLAGFDYQEHAPYHVTICARAVTKPFDRPAIAEMVCGLLRQNLEQTNAYVGAYCLMPDHLHVLLSPDRSGLSLGQLIGQFKGVSTNASWKLGWSGLLWQPRFYDHIVRKREGIAKVARYIYENSDRAALSPDYPYRFVDTYVT